MKKPIIVTISAVFAGAIIIASVVALAMSGSKTTASACQQKGATRTVTINKGIVSPASTEAKLCDDVTIINIDPETRKIGFGEHNKHKTYSGVSEKILRKGQSFTITVTETGTIGFHDHYHHDTEGTLIVTN